LFIVIKGKQYIQDSKGTGYSQIRIKPDRSRMKSKFRPVLRLTLIFILVVIVSGSLLTYFSINNIANLKELTEKKILEEEQNIIVDLQKSITMYIENLTSGFSPNNVLDSNIYLTQQDLKIDSIIYPYILDSERNFIYPNFIHTDHLKKDLSFSNQFNRSYQLGEVAEFKDNNPLKAKNHYSECLKISRDRQDSVKARNAIGRIASKMNDKEEVLYQYCFIIEDYFSEISESGIPFAYFAVKQLIQTFDDVDRQKIVDALLFFVNKLYQGLIPLTYSTVDVLNSISKWVDRGSSIDTLDISEIEILRAGIINQITFIDQYTKPIHEVLNLNNFNNTMSFINGFKAIPTSTGNFYALILINEESELSYGYVIEYKRLVESLIDIRNPTGYEFDYELKLSEDINSLHQNTGLTYTSQINTFFPDLLLQIRLRDENVIREYISRRSWIYGISIVLLLMGMILGVFLILRDITREKHLSRLRADFISTVTHELKTPLTSIYMFAESLYLRRITSGKQRQEYLSIIIKESERLKRLINNILEFSKIERGKLEYHFSETNVSELLGIVLDEMRYWFMEKNLQVRTELEDIILTIDREKMKQVFTNVLSNAIKYSRDSTQISIRLHTKDHKMIAAFKDEGIGIPQDEIPHIFDKYYRVEQNETENISGTGLGLTVVKEIMDAHNGEVFVESESGKGSKFSIVLNLNS
jgi:signal transduction histidine kinase